MLGNCEIRFISYELLEVTQVTLEKVLEALFAISRYLKFSKREFKLAIMSSLLSPTSLDSFLWSLRSR